MIASLSLCSPAVAQDAAEKEPWSVESRSPIEQHAFAFRNDGAELRGTLFMPRGGHHLPVVIAFHGAAAPSLDHPLYRHLKTMLPPLGVAVFVFDRRGTGRSTGNDARKTDFDLLASDGVAALRALAADPRFDPRRIGFWGLSQGGWLTLLAAAKEPRAAFAVAVSAPMAGADVQMNYAVENVLRIKGYPQVEIDRALAARRAVDRYVRGETDRASAERLYHDAEKRPCWHDSYLAGNLDDPTWKGQMAADPLRALDEAHVPTLMIFGQADPWVPVAPALAALDATSAKHPNVTLRVIDGADHSMMLGVSPREQIDPAGFNKIAPDAPAYFALLASWLTERGIVGTKR